MKKTWMILFWLALLVPTSGFSDSDDWRIDRRESWDVIIRQFHEAIAHAQRTREENREYRLKELQKFDSGFQDVKKRAGELKYLFWDEERFDVLAVTMYARQINDLKHGLDEHVKELQQIKTDLEEEKLRGIRLMESFSGIDRTLVMPENFAKINDCINACKYYVRTADELLAATDQRLERGKILQEEINQLNSTCEKRRDEISQQVVFSRNNNFFQVLPTAKMALKEWSGYLVDWLEIEIPDSPDFWHTFLLWSVVLGISLTCLGKPIYQKVAELTSFPEQEQKLWLFMGAWVILVLSGLCYMAKLMVYTVEGTIFVQAGQFLFALGWLLIALLIRVNRKTMRHCLLLYSPLILLHLFSALLCILVVPYVPLTVLLPIVVLPVILLMLWLLFHFSYTLMDKVIGALTVLMLATTLMLSLSGLAYLGLSIITVWFLAVSGLLAGVAVTGLVKSYVSKNSKRKIISSMLFTLLVPAMWIFIVCELIYWTAGMYNREAFLNHILVSNFLSCKDVIEISIVDILFVIAVGFVLQFVLATIKHLVHIIFGKDAEMGLIPSFMTLGTYLAWMLYVIFVLLRFDVRPSSILVVVGGMSFGIGFGFKDIVENFISGIIILAGRSIRPGDTIEYNGTWGKIRKVSIRATVIETSENAVITLPNTHVLTKDFHNWTLNNTYMRRSIKIRVVYGAEISVVRQLIMDIASSDPDVLRNPPPTLHMAELADTGMDFVLDIGVDVADRSKVPGRIRENIEIKFKEAGIALSGPPRPKV